MISLAARGGIDIEDIVDQLKSCGTCPSYAVRRAKFGDTSVGSSCPVAVGNALIAMHEEMIQQINFGLIKKVEDEVKLTIDATTVDGVQFQIKPVTFNTVKCPECGGDLVFEGGCNSCKQCGYSKCD
jgi:ribonucleoside-diphosphate reductase alpha chain